MKEVIEVIEEKKQVTLTLKIDKDLHKAFREYAKERRDTMTRLLIECIKKLIEEEKENL